MPEPTTGPTPTGHGNGVNKREIPPHDKYELQVGGGDVGDFGDTDGPIEMPPHEIEALRQHVQQGNCDRKSLESVASGLPASLLDELLHLADQVAGETLAFEEPPKRGRGRRRKKATYPAGLSGAAMAPYLVDHFRLVDTDKGDVYWRYHHDEGRWGPLTTTSQALRRYIYSNSKQWRQELDADGQQELADSWAWDTPPPERSEFWTALGQGILAPEPTPAMHLLNAPSGTLDLRTSEKLDHAAELECRAITAGAFRPEDAAALERLLRERLDRVLSPDMQDIWLDMVALAMTGDAQMYRSILYIFGESALSSGSGKSGLNNLVSEALGTYGHTVSVGFFGHHTSGEIDATRAEVLASQARWLSCDELGAAGLRVNAEKILSLTGDSTDAARGPYGGNIQGGYYFMLGVATIGAPEMPRDSGIARRLAAVPALDGEVPEEERERPNQDHLDAVVTVCGLRAARRYQTGYRAPTGDAGTKDKVLREMDPVGSWLADYRQEIDPDGILVSELLKLAQADLDPRLTAVGLGKIAVRTGLYQRAKYQGVRWLRPV